MESVVIDPEFWSGRRVFLTGHTGFKGSWLALWLSDMGAEVHGYALEPPSQPNLFEISRVESCLASHTIGNIVDGSCLETAMRQANPSVVLHLAAQPLVRYSYSAPVETFEVNVMGTVNVLQAARAVLGVEAVVNVTTDKCYLNREWLWPYRENEAMGGHDPYSASKACAESVTAAYRTSFCADGHPWIASARAGNVIGGGDWASDRIVPDALRAIDSSEMLVLRSPGAIRPWQHVLEPLAGYLALAQRLVCDGHPFAEAWNFGPHETDARSVSWIVEYLAKLDGSLRWTLSGSEKFHEAGLLKLDSSRARTLLSWEPRWSLSKALEATLEWHREWRAGTDMSAVCREQIATYLETVSS